jgi:hypothetical protein
VSSVVVVPAGCGTRSAASTSPSAAGDYEDTAFAAAAETFAGIVRMPGEVWHLWHPTATEGKRGTESWSRNSAKGQRYRAAIGDRDAIRALQAEGVTEFAAAVAFETRPAGIPKILHRVVPERTSRETERWWMAFGRLHPGWELRTHRDPLDPADFPETSAKWPACANGAQLADLVRLEVLYRFGGVYVDSDVEPLRPLDPLLPLSAFAAWEDPRSVPNAVMGAVPGHPAIRACLDLALERVPGDTWQAGPGVTTKVLQGRDDVLLLPPGSFYPYHYREKARRSEDFRRYAAVGVRRAPLGRLLAGRGRVVIADPCVRTTWCLNRDGYGERYVGGRGGQRWRAHRYAWTQVHGPIPDGLNVLHRCDNRACINVAHLFLGTHGDNVRDRHQKGRDGHASLERSGGRVHPERIPRGSRNGSSKLTEEDIPRIRVRLAGGETIRSVARSVGVSFTAMQAIAAGRTWRHVQ